MSSEQILTTYNNHFIRQRHKPVKMHDAVIHLYMSSLKRILDEAVQTLLCPRALYILGISTEIVNHAERVKPS